VEQNFLFPAKTGMKNRKLTRLANYDYSRDGMYFVTVCSKNRKCLFGEIINEEMILSDAGKILKNIWLGLPNHYVNAKLDEYIIMPNHFHCILEIISPVGTGFKPVPGDESIPENRAGFKPAPTKHHPLSEIIRGLKTFSSKLINQKYNTPGNIIWQRSFYDRIIRNESELNRIREYIFLNPSNWETDRNYSGNFN
jgi:putative transposase